MRIRCLDAVHQLARADERVVFIGSDLSPDLLAGMKAEFPDRFYMEGVSEAHVIGMAAGMAMAGYVPYVNTIATFLTRRCLEQIAIDLCLHNLPVRLIANGGGLVYAPLGPTHEATDDIALLRVLPNMAIVAVCDAEEMQRLMPLTVDWPGPLYIRLAKGGDRVVSRGALGFEIGKAIHLRRSDLASDRIVLVATGVATTRALEAAEQLAGEGLDCDVLHMHTIKPLDETGLLNLAEGARLVVTVEEHSRIGGLGSAVTDCLIDRLDTRTPSLRRIALPDAFPEGYGSQDSQMTAYGLQPAAIANTVRAALGLPAKG